jgi:hypothetical protein
MSDAYVEREIIIYRRLGLKGVGSGKERSGWGEGMGGVRWGIRGAEGSLKFTIPTNNIYSNIT